MIEPIISWVMFPLKKWLSIAALTIMLMFAVATHTVEFLANLTGQVIHVATGLTTTTQRAHRQIEYDRRIAAEVNNLDREVQERLARQSMELREVQQLDNAVNERLARENVNLRQLMRLEQRRVSELTEAQRRLNRTNVRLTREITDLKSSANTIRQNSTAVLSRIQSRTSKTASVNVGSVFGEAVPFWGIAVVVGATTFELTSACQNMEDLYSLQVSIAPQTAIPDDRDEVCGIQVPTREEIWTTVKASPRAAWRSAVSAAQDTTNWAANLEPPNFGAWWDSAMGMLPEL